jgi:cardiolipin synthase
MILAGNGIIILKNVLAVVYLITVFAICLMIVFENRNPVKTLSWMLVILLIPVAGMIIYFFFGRNYRKQKIYSRKSLADRARLEDHADHQVRLLSSYLSRESPAIRSKEHLIHLMLRNTGHCSRLTTGLTCWSTGARLSLLCLMPSPRPRTIYTWNFTVSSLIHWAWNSVS